MGEWLSATFSPALILAGAAYPMAEGLLVGLAWVLLALFGGILALYVAGNIFSGVTRLAAIAWKGKRR